MTLAIHKSLGPLIAMNRRLSIGGGILVFVLISESALAFIKPFA